MTEGIRVNGTTIPEQAILAEMQHHPAPSVDGARDAAARALALRELLLQRVAALGLSMEQGEEAAISALIEREVSVPEPDEESCRRWFEKNRAKFRRPALFEASHILFPAPPEEAEAREEARQAAKHVLKQVLAAPHRFGALARAYSACPSRENDGSLGQVAQGDTVPELETFFLELEPGQIAPVAVPSSYGYHIVQLHHRIPAQDLPFEVARDQVVEHLMAGSWTRAVHQYLHVLAGEADVDGVDLDGATSPLVQ